MSSNMHRAPRYKMEGLARRRHVFVYVMCLVEGSGGSPGGDVKCL